MATIKQKKAIKLIVGKNVSVKKAMTEAGYKDSVHTNQLTNSKAYAEIMDKLGLSDEYLTKQIKKGIKAKRIISSHTEPDREYPDWANRHKYIETALKVKGAFSEQQGSEGNITIINPIAVQVNTKATTEEGT